MGLIDYDLYKKTYRISESFNKSIAAVGESWIKEVNKKPLNVKFSN